MDGPHDLGGRQGFGPVGTDETAEAFHSAWEARMWGIARSLKQPPGWTIDWWRHGRELIDPADYLTRPYYDQWMQTYTALLIDSGVFTVDELVAVDHAVFSPPPTASASSRVDVTKVTTKRFDRDTDDPPRFTVGDGVRANTMGVRGHTRLPAYVRGRVGIVDRAYGAHILPDANAHGDKRAEPLYSIKFTADTLWPEAAGRRDSVYVDMWECYLEPA